jgi:fido (protein-threonine AMPylation protein)
MKFHYPLGATPLEPDEIEALIPQHISLQSEINQWEQKNILEAEEWVFAKKHKDIFSIESIQTLHKKMFDRTWKCAGKFRTSMKNIGIEVLQIQPELYKLCGDISYQIDHKVMGFDE